MRLQDIALSSCKLISEGFIQREPAQARKSNSTTGGAPTAGLSRQGAWTVWQVAPAVGREVQDQAAYEVRQQRVSCLDKLVIEEADCTLFSMPIK